MAGTVTAPARRSSGWLAFAGVLILTLGVIHVINGLTALGKDEYYQVSSDGLLVWDFTAWGWLWLILGVVQILVGLGVLRGNAAARAAGVVLTAIAVIGQIAFLAAFPLWSLVVIGIGLLVLYALIAPPGDAEA
ncbi:DUF7144 family membrane protein [Streptomyces sp. 4N509B]|uniref:DUF7144 family membrane protein n=1 Tax=Streptomyces sp. 4N509B TaxID=3457413 RepID=UPI003FD49EEA